MGNYLETIAAAQQAAVEKAAARDVVEKERNQKVEIARAQAEAFLKNTVFQEVEAARADLESAGISADIGNGQSEGALRCSLIIHPPHGGDKSILFLAMAQNEGVIAPLVLCDDKSIAQSRDAVQAAIRTFISRFVTWNPKRQ